MNLSVINLMRTFDTSDKAVADKVWNALDFSYDDRDSEVTVESINGSKVYSIPFWRMQVELAGEFKKGFGSPNMIYLDGIYRVLFLSLEEITYISWDQTNKLLKFHVSNPNFSSVTISSPEILDALETTATQTNMELTEDDLEVVKQGIEFYGNQTGAGKFTNFMFAGLCDVLLDVDPFADRYSWSRPVSVAKYILDKENCDTVSEIFRDDAACVKQGDSTWDMEEIEQLNKTSVRDLTISLTEKYKR